MRDRRYVAVHRGGLLTLSKHRALALWAADCAEHVLPLFEACTADKRPRKAIEVARAWARGEVSVGQAQKASVQAHAAARAMTNKAAIAAARAAGHAVATAHCADHSLGPAIYGPQAVAAAGKSPERERAWQMKQVPRGLRTLIASALKKKLQRRGGSIRRRAAVRKLEH